MTRIERLRLLLVDDHLAVREALRRRLDAVPRFQVVAEADDISQALTQLGTTSPDLAVIDIGLGKEDGLLLARLMRERYPETRVLIWSMHDNAAYVTEAKDAGARGYVPKSHSTEEVVRAIEVVADGGSYYASGMDPGEIGPARGPVAQSRSRERQILELVSSTRSGEQIAVETSRERSVQVSAPTRIEDYEILDEIDHGGMGVVYRARHGTTGRIVGLKMLRSGKLATAEGRRRFRTEIKAVAALDHRHIVPIYEVGEHEGHPYYTMRLCTGSLDKQLTDYRVPARAAALVATVARAVHHGHERGVLHRDLKPANILLDEEGEPYVSDFGAAKYIDEAGQTDRPLSTEIGLLIGTLPYIAPERVRSGDRGVTTAVDQYSLGVILYELLTGRLPFEGDRQTVMRDVLETEPARPRMIEPKVPRDLETICLKCLEKEPAKRYRSAAELADDLDQFLQGRPIAARPANIPGRAWRFTRRHPVAVGVIVLLAVIAVTAVYVAREQEQELQRAALQTNAYAADALAGKVAFRLREQIDEVVAMAADPAIARVRGVGDEGLGPRRAGTAFDTIGLYDRSGVALAEAPPAPPANYGRSYAWRDYFLGARRLGLEGLHAGYVSRAFRSESDNIYKFGITAPIYEAGTWAGVLLGTLGTDSALGNTRLDRVSEGGPMAVVVAPRDRSRATTKGEGDYVVILHDGLDHGAEIAFDSPRLRELGVTRTERDQLRWIDPEPVTDDAHRDPVPGFEGRWLAGFAPVGNTGFVVIVQTRYDAAVAPNARLRQIATVGVVTLSSVVLGLGLWGFVRRRRRARARTRDHSNAS